MEELKFNYEVRKSHRRKTLSIIVHPDNRVIVAAPATYSPKNILQFVEKKADWIRKAIQANLQRGRQCREKRFQTGDKLLYLGREYILRVERGSASQVILGDEDICVRLKDEGAGPGPSAVEEHLLEWYHARALAKVKEKVTLYAGRIGVNPRLVALKSLKSRWGSCSVHGRISLAWNIIMAPEAVLDYLVVHELCHMVHHDHSAGYWRLVESVLPDHRERRQWLRKNGERLIF